MKNSLVFFLFFLINLTFAQVEVFPDLKKYPLSFENIKEKLIETNQLNYIKVNENSLNLPNHKYRIDKRNEFRIKNWFQRDWFELQSLFEFDIEKYMSELPGDTFLEKKILQFNEFGFNKKTNLYKKNFYTMKEWGGLTHPPLKEFPHNIFNHKKLINKNFTNESKINNNFYDINFQTKLDNISKSELTIGNTLQIVADKAGFDKKMELIEKANEVIFISSLVFVCDISTNKAVEKLIEKHNKGIKVYVIVDGLISVMLGHMKCVRKMRKAGIEVLVSKDFSNHQKKAIYHAKTLVVDYEESVSGGQNFIDADHRSRGVDFSNRDIDLYAKGPMSYDIAKQFLENWQYLLKIKKTKSKQKLSELNDYLEIVNNRMKTQRENGVRGVGHYKNFLDQTNMNSSGLCRFIKQAPYQDQYSIGNTYLELLDSTQNYLIITDPVKSDTYYKNRKEKPLIEKNDKFDMFNKLHFKVQELAKNNIKIDYLTTNMDMTGNENVAIYNERIKHNLDHHHYLKATFGSFMIWLSNKMYGVAHYKNLINDYLPYENVQIWKHISFLHSKVFYFDRTVASIGSYNFQHNATDHAYESTAVCMDKTLNQQLEEVLLLDMMNSLPLVESILLDK